MIKKFEKEKSYVCRMDLIAASPGMTASDLGGWMKDLDGQPVEVLSETNGAVGKYRVEPWWCEEVMAVYIDERGWKYKVMGGIGEPETFKARYNKPGTSKWRGLSSVEWRESFDEAQQDLDVLAKSKGWAVCKEDN